MSRNQLIDEVNKWLRRFDISEEEILTAAELDRLHLEAYRRTLPESVCPMQISDQEPPLHGLLAHPSRRNSRGVTEK